MTDVRCPPGAEQRPSAAVGMNHRMEGRGRGWCGWARPDRGPFSVSRSRRGSKLLVLEIVGCLDAEYRGEAVSRLSLRFPWERVRNASWRRSPGGVASNSGPGGLGTRLVDERNERMGRQ